MTSPTDKSDRADVSGPRLRMARNIGGALFLIGFVLSFFEAEVALLGQFFIGLGGGAFLTTALIDAKPSIWGSLAGKKHQ